MSDTYLLGVSRQICALRLQCPHLAAWRGPVVIIGRTGTGKGVLMEEIRRHLPPAAPFARIAATAARHSLLYSQLFGFLKGTFTGAQRDHQGLLAALNGGVLFLDDFQDLGDELQLYLVDIADGKACWPLGAERPVTPNVRIVLGTQQPLEELWRQKKLREDLYERLNGVRVELPVLEKRPEDIPVLARGWLARLAVRESRPIASVTDEAMCLMLGHSWPRNVRELEKTLERAAFLAYCEAPSEPVIESRHLASEAFAGARRGRGRPKAMSGRAVLETISATGSTKAAAIVSGVSQRTVQRERRRAEVSPG
jgi:DNA-binding NtrC family response regulator